MVSELLVQTLDLVWAKNQCEFGKICCYIFQSVTNLGKNIEN
jgi:hypothetical protein